MDSNPPNGTEASNALPDDSKQNGLLEDGTLPVLEMEDATAERSVVEGKFRLPHIGYALLWSLLLLFSQLIIGIGLGIVAVAYLAATGKMAGPNLGLKTEALEEIVNRFVLPVATLVTLLIAVGVVAMLFRKQAARCMGLRGMTATQTGLVLLSALPLAVLTSEFTNCAAHLLPNTSLDLFVSFSQESWLLVFIAACLFPGIGEELFFRGFLSRGLVAHHGLLLGTLFTSLLFGAIHLHPIQACGAFALGLVLQFVFLATRSLWGAVLLHTANNTIAFVAMKYGHLFPIPGFTTTSPVEALTDRDPTPRYDELIRAVNGLGPEAIAHTSPVLVIVAMVATASLLWAIHQTRTRWTLPDDSQWSHDYESAAFPEPGSSARCENSSATASHWLAVILAYAAFVTTLVWNVVR